MITVAAVDAQDRLRPSSAPANAGLAALPKPEVLAYDDGGGTGQAASFAAGLAASYWPLAGTLFGVVERLQDRPGQVLRGPR
ncbi:MAG: hypothetical protein U0736_10095 [Gemmataceae bacterium]